MSKKPTRARSPKNRKAMTVDLEMQRWLDMSPVGREFGADPLGRLPSSIQHIDSSDDTCESDCDSSEKRPPSR